jgi:hypothetical protein
MRGRCPLAVEGGGGGVAASPRGAIPQWALETRGQIATHITAPTGSLQGLRIHRAGGFLHLPSRV